ncbi:MAG TPA: type II toxin-antitoxin system HicB family antitoxin, partial [Pirellulales bacterium]|nr:type II toxin-antitoxin system HicB family antitoxin [Pirellulales bacterium]
SRFECRATDTCAVFSIGEPFSMLLKVVFEASEEGGYTVFVPALPGCISEGDTLEESRENIREAIALYLEQVDEPQAPAGGFVEEIAV